MKKAVALASYRRLRACVRNSLRRAYKVLPQYYGTSKNTLSHGTVESVLHETDANGRADAPATESGSIGCAGVDSDQLRPAARIGVLCWAATALMGIRRNLSADRAGDRTREGLRQQEAGVVTGSGREKECPTRSFYFLSQFSWGPFGRGYK